MTRAEIITQLDAELSRLARARDYLTSALKGSKARFLGKLDITLAQKVKKQRARPMKPMVLAPQAAPTVVTPVLVVVAEPQIKRVPPRRRAERRPAQADKLARSTAALSGAVPAGPVVVSANEARKHERTGTPAVVLPMVTEMRSEIGAERSLGSLIQAFERQTGFNGAETP